MDLTGPAIDWWRRRRLTAPRYRTVQHYPTRTQLPPTLPRRTIAVIDGPHGPKWIIVPCPCGHKHRIELVADPSHHPAWRLTETPDGATISPSVDVHQPRRCHFWLRHGRVHWADA